MMKLSTFRVFGLGALIGVSASVSTSCSPPPAQCSATTCANGCCANGQCVGGTAPTACGSRGNMCVSCPTGFSCTSGSCTPTNMGGGFATGGGSAGGSTAGGAAAGGRAGGSAAGGSAAGGSAAGGSAAGGSAAGGSAAGGAAAGGAAAGGAAAGGSAAGGSAAGGSAGGDAGGSAAGGSAAGGSAAGGSAAGGSAAGGSAAGGSAAGGSAAGGSAAGGSAAGGSAGGGSAGGSTNPADVSFFVVRVSSPSLDGGIANQFPDGGVTLSSSASFVTLEERNLMSGSQLRTVALSVGSGSTFTLSGTATSEGTLNRSADGRYLVLGGYNAAIGLLNVVNAAVPRAVARISAPAGMSPTVDSTTTFSDGFGANNFRAACTNDGTGYWGTGTGSSAGTRYVVHGAMGTSTSIYTASSNTRACDVYGGQLWVSTASGTGIPADGGTRIYSLGALPTTAASSPTYLPGMGNQNPQTFALFDNNAAVAGLDLLYATDTTSGGIRKYTFDGMTWTEVTQFNLNLNAADGGTTGATCLQLAAQRIGADYYVLCVTSDASPNPGGTNTTGMGNRVLRFVDVGGGATFSPMGATVFTAGPFDGLRGIAFSPQ